MQKSTVKVVVHGRYLLHPAVASSGLVVFLLSLTHLHHPGRLSLTIMAMENLSLLFLVVLLAGSPLLAAAWLESGVGCGGNGRSYGANSTYEANLRHLAAVLPAETSASHSHPHGHSVDHAIGYWPNRVQATAICWSGDGDDCATCIAEAFKEVERVCPFRREATFFGRRQSRDCYLRLAEFRIFSILFGRSTMVQALVMGMIFQAFGLACLFFLFLQAWRHDGKKCTMTRHTPLLSGDQ